MYYNTNLHERNPVKLDTMGEHPEAEEEPLALTPKLLNQISPLRYNNHK